MKVWQNKLIWSDY